jgi:hypothetical protein
MSDQPVADLSFSFNPLQQGAPMAPHKQVPKPKVPVVNPPKETDAAKDKRRLNDKMNWMLVTNAYQNEVMANAESWLTAARNIGSAYKIATENHKTTLKKQELSDAVSNQWYALAITVFTAGALSWISTSVQAAVEKALKNGTRFVPSLRILEAVEDSAKAGAGAVFGNLRPAMLAPDLAPASMDPQVNQNNMENEISDVKEAALRAFQRILLTASTAPLESWDKIDRKEQDFQHAIWRAKAALLAGNHDIPSVPQMAEEFERGIWALFVREEHSHWHVGSIHDDEPDSPDYVGDDVSKRIEKLGVRQARKGAWEGAGKQTSALWNWAKMFKIKNYIELKRMPAAGTSRVFE